MTDGETFMFTGLEQAFHISHCILNTKALKCRDCIIVRIAFVCQLYELQIRDSGITANVHCLFQVYGMNLDLYIYGQIEGDVEYLRKIFAYFIIINYLFCLQIGCYPGTVVIR
jgi:hypothetical protein